MLIRGHYVIAITKFQCTYWWRIKIQGSTPRELQPCSSRPLSAARVVPRAEGETCQTFRIIWCTALISLLQGKQESMGITCQWRLRVPKSSDYLCYRTHRGRQQNNILGSNAHTKPKPHTWRDYPVPSWVWAGNMVKDRQLCSQALTALHSY